MTIQKTQAGFVAHVYASCTHVCANIFLTILGNTLNLQLWQFATCAICNTCNLQHVQLSANATCNICIVHNAICKNTPISPMEVTRALTVLVRGGECPVIPLVHWKWAVLPWQRSLRILKTLTNFMGFYSLCCAVERFPYLRDFLLL